MKTGIFLGAGLFVAAVLLGVVQLWFPVLTSNTFIKIELTLGAAFLVVVIICIVFREYNEDKANRKGHRLD
jgi:protein-S-isoprenylcysteine O-methyltransferase Ste14